MFYSHQLLARNAPLGQICEEILNPSGPMALQLSGILIRTHLSCGVATLPKSKMPQPVLVPDSGTKTYAWLQQLDELEDECIKISYNSSQSIHQHHQADHQNITILDEMDSFLPTENDLYNRFETFDIFGDNKELQFTQDERKDEFMINPTPPSQKGSKIRTKTRKE
ncbi:hypothetical protein ZOSMA_14G01830 [Zostera marina]|uniref:Uncharacterized protein n=1 Tax=Zostera marina TaxID=29655 RepID=A0A0K9PYV0_ZOSMR|nr:hypothetical protein ZOSMA_14G01830 [Zostera marina]